MNPLDTLTALASRHFFEPMPDETPRCFYDGQEWPCDANRLAAYVTELEDRVRDFAATWHTANGHDGHLDDCGWSTCRGLLTGSITSGAAAYNAESPEGEPAPRCICGTDAALAAGETVFARLDVVCPKHDPSGVVSPETRRLPDRLVRVVHLEDPAGSGLAACCGLPFDVSEAAGDVFWLCTGCANAGKPREAIAGERRRIAEAVRGLRSTVTLNGKRVPSDWVNATAVLAAIESPP